MSEPQSEPRYVVLTVGATFVVADNHTLVFVCNRLGVAFTFFDRESAQTLADTKNEEWEDWKRL